MVLLGFEHLPAATAALAALGTDAVLSERRRALLDDPPVVVTRASGVACVHVLSEEMAFVAPAMHGLELVASDDATTCSIVILSSNTIVAVAHIDSPQQMAYFLSKWEAVTGTADSPARVAIAGGYTDEREISQPITLDILQTLIASDTVFEVRQFIAGEWNSRQTESGMLPCMRGIGYFPAQDVYRQVEFEREARHPMEPLRFAGVAPDPLHLLMECVEIDVPLAITVGPYEDTLLSPGSCDFLLALSDDQLLTRISTSPLAEGPKFLQDMREITKNMEPSFIATPYVQVEAPLSRQIREILDREEASYVDWRKMRKPVRLPYASAKLSRPYRQPDRPHYETNQSKSFGVSRCREAATESSKAASSQDPLKTLSSTGGSSATHLTRRKGAMRPMGALSRSTGFLPSLSGSQVATDVSALQTKQKSLPVQLAEPVGAGKTEQDSETSVSSAPRGMARKQLQRYLYDFHSRQVFSYTASDATAEDDEEQDPDEQELSTNASENGDEFALEGQDTQPTTAGEDSMALESVLEGNRQHQAQQGHEECVVPGLSFLAKADYDAIFEVDWRLSEVEKTVRDAVDRNRIRGILQKAYRVLLWFFRYYAGNAVRVTAPESRLGTGAALGEELFEIPSRVRLLEDLNVQCVDAAKYGVTDTPLKREHLIDFLLRVARMMCAHSSNPNRLRWVISEGVEMSDAVKTLVHDHFAVFAQIQDVGHFRSLFLYKPTASTSQLERKLQDILGRHRTNLTHFFEDQTAVGVSNRTGGSNDRVKGQQQRGSNGVRCAQFLSALRAIHMITSAAPASTNTSSNTDGAASAGAPAGVEQVRAVRIFLSCLPMKTTNECLNQGPEPRELTFAQFVEALLRVAFTWKELAICHGGFDVCPSQMTSEVCQCRPDSVQYAFDVFETAVEELFTRIHAYRVKRVQKHTNVQMKSVHSFRTLVTLATSQKAPARLQSVAQSLDGKSSNNNPLV
ncbi:hypothetical protein BBJ28_00015581 [Nothophytophthora sp. Chile5]|nr:hypothetical protein BBJ28_00015581 [Nothophytophthora sp. Chile5]